MTSTDKAVQREMAIISVAVTKGKREKLLDAAENFNARIVSIADDAYVFEITGSEEKVDTLLKVLRPFGIKKVALWDSGTV